jgi:hypothetical protein
MKRKVLVVDVGGTYVKLLRSSRDEREFPSGPRLKRQQLVAKLKETVPKKILHKKENRRYASTSRQFEFHKRRQLFIRMHNETLSVAPTCVSNADRLPVGIQG